jgi:hypothetical protein
MRSLISDESADSSKQGTATGFGRKKLMRQELRSATGTREQRKGRPCLNHQTLQHVARKQRARCIECTDQESSWPARLPCRFVWYARKWQRPSLHRREEMID